MDLRKIKKLIELLEDSSLVEIEVTEGESAIRLSRAGKPSSETTGTGGHPIELVSVMSEGREEPVEGTRAEESSRGTVVKSPMVGTFYNAPSPEAEPFILEGSSVRVGQTLCIVEAMKTLNQIESETDGVVRRIYKHNGDPVEYGEPLFLIE